MRAVDATPATGSDGVVKVGGEVAAEMEHVEWAATSVGPPDGWSPSLRSAVQILLTSRFAMWLGWGPDLAFFYNDAYQRDTLQAKHPWALGRPAREVWAEIWDDIAPRIEHVMSTGTATWDEALLLFLERSGYREETYHTFSYSPLAGDDGSTAGMLCVVVEETDRVLSERRLATLRALAAEPGTAGTEEDVLRAMGQRLGDNERDLPFALIYLFDADGLARLACATGIAPGDPIAPSPIEPGSAEASRWQVDELLAGGGAVTVTLAEKPELPTGKWDEPPREAVVIPLFEVGTPRAAGFLVAGVNPYRALDAAYRGFLDLVARQIAASVSSVRSREADRRRGDALAELDRAKTIFFSNVSHEFRTPLSLILGPMADALDAADEAEQRDRLSIAFRNALRLQKLVNNLLDFSSIEAGRAEPAREPTDLAEFTAELVSMFRSATERAGIELVVERPDGPVPASVDREMWERIVLNLISNAFKFTFEGEIRVSLRHEDGHAVLVVSDTGTGIAEKELSRLFERFRRVRGAHSRTDEGSGIGLALVHELVRLHGGHVDVDSELGAGTRFTVGIPLDDAVEPAVSTDAAPTSGASAYIEEALRWLPDSEAASELQAAGAGLPGEMPGGRRRARVLIADDNADLRDYLARLLHRHWDVEAVADGRAALAAIRAGRPDLVVSDAMMPELDGFELLAALRAEPSTAQLPVIMLSARAGEEAAVEGLAAGADDYLVKPFSSRELIARVRANLDLAELRQAAARATERHAQLLRDVADAAVAINRAQTVPAVLEIAARRARDVVGAEWGLARLTDEHGGHERLAAAGDSGAVDTTGARQVALLGTGGRLFGELLLGGEVQTGGIEGEAILTQLAQVASTRLENALLYEREHRVAETLQRSLLPESLPELRGAELAAVYLPGSTEASVGGDWYDAMRLAETTVALVIGDVVGRGVNAASAMGRMRNAVRAYVLEGYSPAETLARVNRLLHTVGGGGFATLFCALVDLERGTIRYASAGHPPPLVVEADAATRWLDAAVAPPVGAAPDIEYREAEDVLPAGSAVVLYTDGLVERRGEHLDIGLARLAATAVDSPGHAVTLADLLVEGMPWPERADDVALLVLARQGGLAEPLVVRLPAQATSLAPLRALLRRWMAQVGIGRADGWDLLLAAGEAASNAVEHPIDPEPAAIVVTARRTPEGAAVIEVRDHGRWRDQAPDRHRGHGLQIMRAVAQRVEIARSAQGSAITLHRRLGGPAA